MKEKQNSQLNDRVLEGTKTIARLAYNAVKKGAKLADNKISDALKPTNRRRK